MIRGVGRLASLVAIAAAFFGAAHPVAMSSGGAAMHGRPGSSDGVVLTCVLLVAVVAMAAHRLDGLALLGRVSLATA